MDSRRDFLKKAAMLSGSMGFSTGIPPSILRALSIDPEANTSFMDAEHVVLLMQENRSFDHAMGSLKGVRGFNDPRAFRLANNNPVWAQTDKDGKTYFPFHLDINDTKATWTGDLPHAWEDQVDARNDGKYDKWLEAKVPHKKDFKHIPLTMGYYNRKDIPFYYAFADAFTVFDQHFCSSLTGTTTNRLFFWSGTHKAGPEDTSHVRNSEVNFDHEVSWKTFPERLEEAGVSWKVYQNEISMKNELGGEDAGLLGNFSDNNLEWFKQYNVRFSESHWKYLEKRKKELPSEIETLKKELSNAAANHLIELRKKLDKMQAELEKTLEELQKWSPENFAKLSEYQKNLHKKAFVTNSEDPDYHTTEELEYTEEGKPRKVRVPKGDILYQFRKDVDSGNLPAVSWVVAPGKFSDHPSAPWYGAWYVSEVLDILTKNPEVWKKTIFILTYDENDGYFDHIPPFVAPNPKRENAFSKGINTETEYVTLEDEINRKGVSKENAREHAVGLGYRVPMIVASPWTRGGWVNSQVCDITSTIMLMEKWIKEKTGKDVTETNISNWRRTICSDLTSAFRKEDKSKFKFEEFLDRDTHMTAINNASFKQAPSNYKALSREELAQARKHPQGLADFPQQEKGIKSACALPYELYVDGNVTKEVGFQIDMKCGNAVFGKSAAGAPFNIYARNAYREDGKSDFSSLRNWTYAVKAGDALQDQWDISRFSDNAYHLEVFGPNGFYREFAGESGEPNIQVVCSYEFGKQPRVIFSVKNVSSKKVTLKLSDVSYSDVKATYELEPGDSKSVPFMVSKMYNWYDFMLNIEENQSWVRRFAGRIESGGPTKTDPLMGGEV